MGFLFRLALLRQTGLRHPDMP